MCRRLVRASLLLCSLTAYTAPLEKSPPAPPSFEMTCVDPTATYFGTFQSNNQKVVRNARGIFMTHIHSRDAAYMAQEWRLSWSRDGGRSFSTLYSETNATNPPVLESDAAGNIYLGRPDWLDHNAYLYRFLAAEDYRKPHTTKIPGGAAGKYAMMLDEPRRQIYWFGHNRLFARLDLEGRLLSSTNLFAHPSSAVLQYPLLGLDAGGVLHAAWTTVMVPPAQSGRKPFYWDIHYMQSPDGGVTWRTMAGAPVPVPVLADHTGPTDRITLDDEFEVSTWLSNLFAKSGKAHFLYLASFPQPRQHYVRYDLLAGRRDFDLQPRFSGRGIAIQGLSGFFAGRAKGGNSTIYCVSHDASGPRLACLASDDNGTTWYDYAVSDTVSRPYSIGGCREVTPDGWIIGSFTDQPGPPGDNAGGGKVYFFRLRAGLKPRQ